MLTSTSQPSRIVTPVRSQSVNRAPRRSATSNRAPRNSRAAAALAGVEPVRPWPPCLLRFLGRAGRVVVLIAGCRHAQTLSGSSGRSASRTRETSAGGQVGPGIHRDSRVDPAPLRIDEPPRDGRQADGQVPAADVSAAGPVLGEQRVRHQPEDERPDQILADPADVPDRPEDAGIGALPTSASPITIADA